MKIVSATDLPATFFDYIVDDSTGKVTEIIANVRQRGDAALREYSRRFDAVDLNEIEFPQDQIQQAYRSVDPKTVAALKSAADNIRRFAERQKSQLADFEAELIPGVVTGQKVIPIDRVGVYVPGGGFPLVSSLLMGAIPARVAGVQELSVCSPPGHEGDIHPAILVAADIAGVDRIYRVGGAQAVAALAYGTESVGRVDKIVGPGNKYVAQAKKEVFGAVGIDLIAGPTEVLIVADDNADIDLVAADLLAQAEHDVDAAAILVTPSQRFALAVAAAVKAQLPNLATHDIAARAIENNGLIILVDDLAGAAEIVNRKAPEHLEIQLADAGKILPLLRNYGSLFCGEMTAEVLGDYSSGINHTLPTNTTARYRGGLSVYDFLKVQTTLRVAEKGLAAIGPVAEQLAIAEGLDGHRRSVAMRRKKITPEK